MFDINRTMVIPPTKRKKSVSDSSDGGKKKKKKMYKDSYLFIPDPKEEGLLYFISLKQLPTAELCYAPFLK